MTNPPRPRCALRVAAIGHRWDQLDPRHSGAVRAHIQVVLKSLGNVAAELATDPSTGFDGQTPVLTLLSGLAEGTDRLAAQVAIDEPAWRLHAVAPFAVARYEEDFGKEPSLAEFRKLWHAADAHTVLDGPAGDFDAYAPLGRVLVDFADLIVVVWNGERGRGPGGTAANIAAARKVGVPIVRIDPNHLEACWLEDLSETDHGRSRGLGMLVECVQGMMVPSTGDHGADRHHAMPAGYFGESIPVGRLPRVYERLVSAVQRGEGARGGAWQNLRAAADPGVATREQWRPAWSAMPPMISDAVLDRFAWHHGWADQLATIYAARFRQTFTWIFLLAWVAVLAAFLGTTSVDRYFGGVPVAGVIEVGVLAAISRLVLLGRRDRVHERWIEYRALAERLRHLAVIWPMLRSTELVRAPSAHDPPESWVGWMLRSVAREAGLAEATCTPAYAASCRDLLRDAELIPQRAFHSRTMTRSARVQHALAGSAEAFFLAATVLAILHLVMSSFKLSAGSESTDRTIELVLAGLCVTLPAIAASIHGFLGTGDFSGTSLRSAGIEPRLAQLQTRLERLDPIDTTEVGALAVEAAALMETELSTWRTVAQTRELETP